MIKKLDILIIKSFIGPFIVTFFVSLFVLIMQFFWLYMDEMIGKGISIWMLVQLLVYMSTTLVPLALPLSILLSSIMTFGNMGENFELVAIKSSGISLLRFLRPLFIFIIGISVLAFIFSNNVIPVANLKALSLLYDVRNAKPTLNIRPDQFNNEIQGYSIRVGSKDKDGNTIRDVVIYDHTDMSGNNKVILAKEGQMIASPDKQSLIFKLKDGWRYEEGLNRGTHDQTQTRMHFAKWDKTFDLSSFKFTRADESLFKNAYQMMNVKQLSGEIDSLKKYKVKSFNSVGSYIAQYVTIDNKTKNSDDIIKKVADSKILTQTYDSSFLQIIPDSPRNAVLQTTINNLRNFKSLMDVTTLSKKLDSDHYLQYDVEYHRKFTLSFACILLFLIGAPLGAIIRKGGLGMPLVIAVVFFMIFHILNITGEKLAKTSSVIPWLGMWMSTLLLLPLAIWLIIAARNDSQIFTKEWYTRIWRKIKNMLPIKKKPLDNKQQKAYNPYFLYPFVIWVIAGGLILDTFTKEELFFGINTHYSAFGDVVLYYTTWLGEGSIIVLMLLLLFVFARFRNWWFFITTVLCNIIPFGIQQYLKEYFKYPRPRAYFHDSPAMHYLPQWPSLVNNSFPSGHSEGAFSFFCFLSLLLPAKYKKFGFVFFLLALSVGYSRIYLTAHFFEDVYVGSIIGGGCTTIIYAVMYLYKDRFANKNTSG